ncbi:MULTISPECIES: N-6 DNA methylase [Streptomyces]|uniref:N-6 DNA methylase n=1 Tax=Streptomyces TaxID=1883 RepID=UPI0006F75D08|nr:MULTISPECIES: N-6 DNA methylase [unclassified Streptomyces]KQX93029.1 N-6 DNA methylase [Streptomyces sp. Root1319]KQZ17308.1 N-6 DNA methylase [Streptomyces sp. Root55]MDX3064348.1 N-6 DNA methylase [Streptomyces sp. ND04-05B]
MQDDASQTSDSLVTAAEIARLAGVTRAAVSNWRRRYDDFPAPVTDSTSSPLFALSGVRTWLATQHKGQEMSAEVRLWQHLRGTYGDDMVRGLAAVAELLSHSGKSARTGTGAALQSLVEEITAAVPPADLLAALTTRYVESSGRAGSDGITSPQLIRAVQCFAGAAYEKGTVYDPACGIGSLLFSFSPHASVLAGQEINALHAHYAELRAHLTGLRRVTIRVGDSLRSDQQRDLKADLVVCEPPVGAADWGREDLLLDPRWEFGVPSRAESELAWLQHAYHHTAPGGQVVIVMPASVAYRKAGRRIRAEIVRRGVLTQVVALPPGMASAHALSVHLWVLRRPTGPDDTVDFVRMTDLTGNTPTDTFEAAEEQTVEVPRIDLLNDAVDLTPSAHITARHTDFTAEYEAARAEIVKQLTSLAALLPPLRESSAGSLQDGATVSVSELARAGLVETTEESAVSTSDQLDTDYLNGFLRSTLNNRRSTSASGTFRMDARGSRIPQMAIDEQRRYGAVFRSFAQFEQHVDQLTKLSKQVTSLARDGLTSGALRPPPPEIP